MGIADVCYQRDGLDAAREELAAGLPLCRQLSETQALATGLVTLAWIRQAEGEPAGARAAMAEAEQAGPSAAAAGLLNPVPAERARLALAQGDGVAAARWTQQRGLDPDGKQAYTGERDHLVLARVLLAHNQPGSGEIGPPGSSHHCRSQREEHVNMVEQAPLWPKKGPASYFPSIEKKYGRSIAEWQQVIAGCGLEKHMAIVGYLKSGHGMGHGHANALVGWTLAGNVASP